MPNISNKLASPNEEIIRKLRSLRDGKDVAELFEIPQRLLNSVLYGTKERDRYRTFNLPKRSGGSRHIQVPPKNIRILQEKLARILVLVYKPKASVHGFVERRSVCTNACEHTAHRWVLNIDLVDFFGHIHIGRIAGALGAAPFLVEKYPATILGQIACMGDGRLPQGSPCSPILSNIVAHGLDDALTDLARKFNCRYTRYADDITLSTTNPRFPAELARIEKGITIIGDALREAVKTGWFQINDSKVRLSDSRHRQVVTGLTVNEFPNVRRSYVRSIRGALHAWRRHGYDAAESAFQERFARRRSSLRRNLRGKLAYLQQVRGQHDPLVRRLLKEFKELDPTSAGSIPSLTSISASRLRGNLAPASALEDLFRRTRDGVFLLSVEVGADKKVGSAFKISESLLATAGHNLEHGRTWLLIEGTEFELEKIGAYNERHGRDVGLLRLPKGRTISGTSLRSQERLPEIGEQVAAVGFASQPGREREISLNVGIVESLPTNRAATARFIQVGFQSGFGLSGGPLLDRGGYVVGIMIENVQDHEAGSDGQNRIGRPLGQAIPFEYLLDLRRENQQKLSP